VDLTAAYLDYHKIDYHKIRRHDSLCVESTTLCHEKIRQACRSHGCFHITIHLPNKEELNIGEDSSSPIQCLAKPMVEVENEIESLFSPSFLQNNTDTDLNGGLVKVRIKDLPLSRFVEEATFRGRTAESGDEQQSKPEPKLSWEFRRCLSARTAESKGNNDSHNVPTQDIKWNYLSNWTEALHSVASVVIHSMDITQQVVLNEKSCNCLRKIMSNQNDETSSLGKCNVDLLRCFRYDAVPDEEKDDQLLGSSSHTDWGSLTLVWQDDVGGLQTYCHACEKWTDVATPERQNNNTTTSSNNNTINLFVHVGDFLSLATHGQGMTHLPIWPSPRHRVICPTKKRPDQSESSQCRRSLVYFAYPPPNISLAAAQKVVEPLICDDRYESFVMFQDYSLLHDQSQQADQLLNGVNSTNFETYQNMRLRPFGEVISEKWDQVQRN